MDPSREFILKMALGGQFILPGLLMMTAGLTWIRGPRHWQKATGILAMLFGLPFVLFGLMIIIWARIYPK